MRTLLPTPLSPSDRSRHPGSFRPAEPALLAGLLLLLAVGCNRDQVAHYRVPKSSEAAPAASMPPMGMPGMPEADAGAAQPARASLSWTLPKGWRQEPGSGMRFATLKPPVTGKLDVSVIVLPGPAGGELANVNRWRGQMGLPPFDAAAEAAQRKILKTKAGDLAVFDFTGQTPDKGRMVAGLITTSDGNTWFLKMAGDPGPVEQAKPEFMRLMGSIHLD